MAIAHYALMNALLVLNLGALLVGGSALWLGFAASVLLATLVDEAAGEDRALARGAATFFNAMLGLTLPLIALNACALALLFGDGDPFGIVTGLKGIGIDTARARADSGALELAGALMGLGLLTGGAATNVAHELVHRTHRPWHVLTGRWLLAFSFDTTFSIEHVHGHHRHVATDRDPATARRGEYTLAFCLRSTVQGNRSAVRIETERLRRKGQAFWSWHNQVLTGQMMSATIVMIAFAIGGWWGVLAVIATGAQGKLYLELVNYIEHYGLVRVPGSRIEARHSWNTYTLISSGLLYNLPRHSHHHMFASKPFWTLEAEPDGPTYPHGYLTMMMISLIPPLWKRIVHPRLEMWDRLSATEAERALVAPSAPELRQSGSG